jgi:hypothetical protein
MTTEPLADRFPHLVELIRPAGGLGARYGAFLLAVHARAGNAWDVWHRVPDRVVIGFERAEHAKSFRAWIAEQGLMGLLAG